MSSCFVVWISLLIYASPSLHKKRHSVLILLDFLLQGRQLGWTFLQKLKLHRSTATIPVILCTAALSDVLEQEPVLIQKGIPILYKPFDIDDLLHLVSQTLSSAQKQETSLSEKPHLSLTPVDGQIVNINWRRRYRTCGQSPAYKNAWPDLSYHSLILTHNPCWTPSSLSTFIAERASLDRSQSLMNFSQHLYDLR